MTASCTEDALTGQAAIDAAGTCTLRPHNCDTTINTAMVAYSQCKAPTRDVQFCPERITITAAQIDKGVMKVSWEDKEIEVPHE